MSTVRIKDYQFDYCIVTCQFHVTLSQQLLRMYHPDGALSAVLTVARCSRYSYSTGTVVPISLMAFPTGTVALSLLLCFYSVLL